MLGPVSNEDDGVGSGIGCVHALSLVFRMHAGVGAVGGVVCGAQVSRLSGGGPLQLQDVWVCNLEVVEGAEEAPLDARHVLLGEVGVVLGRGVWARPQQGHEVGCHHVWAEL